MNEQLPAALTEAKLRRTSTAEQVADIVRDAILDGSLAPGAPLREGPLAAALSISRHTFREAMRLLVAVGLVSHNLHRGVMVTQLSEADIHDLFRARQVLELAGFDALRADPHDALTRLGTIVDGLEVAARADDWRRLDEHDLAFHRQFVAALGSPRLDTTFAGFQRELRLGLAISDHVAQVPEHRAILDLMTHGRWEDARDLLRGHLVVGEELVAQMVRGREDVGVG